MNMSNLDHARMSACQHFMSDHDLDDEYTADLERAFDIAKEIFHHETPDHLWASFMIDDQGPFDVRLEIEGGAINRTSVSARWIS